MTKYAVNNKQNRPNTILRLSIARKSEARGSSILMGISDYIVAPISVGARVPDDMCNEKPTAVTILKPCETG